MKRGDIVGLIIVLGMLSGVAALFVFAPQRAEVSFAPVEVSGSALVFIEAHDSGVVVDAVLGKPGFVTVHELVGKAPGAIVGVSDFLDVGIYQALFVFTSDNMRLSGDYVMLMVADDGDGVYEPGVDRPVMVNGEVIRVPVEFTSDLQ